MDYPAILAEITDNAATYAGLSDEEIAAALNAMTVPGPFIDVPAGTVAGDLLLAGVFFKLEDFSKSAFTNDATHDLAVMSAKNLITTLMLPQAPLFRMSDPGTRTVITGMLGALVAQDTAAPGSVGITQSIHDGLLALCATTIPWWRSVGAETPLDHGDILAARGERWEDKAIPNYRLASLSWPAQGVVTGATVSPMPFAAGTDVSLVVSACIPNEYDGTFTCHIVDAHTFTYPMAKDPDVPSPLIGQPAAQVGNVAAAP